MHETTTPSGPVGRWTIGSLFSGVGGIELGLESLGLGPVLWQAETEPYCRAVLERHWPEARRLEDVHTVDSSLPRPRIVCGGFPCQDISVAGKKAGLGADRSGLWWEFRRVIRTLCPDFAFVENVGHTWRQWVPVVRRSLWRVGYASLPVRVSAAELGALHQRRRCFVFAYRLRPTVADGTIPGTFADAGGDLLRFELPVAEGRPRARASVVAVPDLARTPADTDGLGQLEPRWVLPKGWGWNCHRRRWHPQPALPRARDGIPHRLDARHRRARERALGNAVVPACAAAAWVAAWSYLFGEVKS